MGFRIARWIIFLICRLFTHVEIEGLDQVDLSGGKIIVSNHLGRLDPALLYYALGREDMVLLAAEKYQKYAIWRWFARQLHAIWVDRYNADMGAVRAAMNRLKEGYLLAVAPEGTRSKTEALIEARSGISYLAARTGVPVVPVAVTGTEDRLVWAQFKRLKRPHIHMKVGKSFQVPPLDPKDREASLVKATDEIMCQIAALLPPKYRGFYAGHPRLKEILENPLA